jgi:nucleoside-diphosphate-sugar epimerase
MSRIRTKTSLKHFVERTTPLETGSDPRSLANWHTESASSIDLIPYERAYESGFEDMVRRVPDTEKIRTLVGWAPIRSREEILDEIIAEARSELARDRI